MAGALIGLLISHLFLALDCQCLRKCIVLAGKIIRFLLTLPIYNRSVEDTIGAIHKRRRIILGGEGGSEIPMLQEIRR